MRLKNSIIKDESKTNNIQWNVEESKELEKQEDNELDEIFQYTIIIDNEILSPCILKILFVLFAVVDRVILRNCMLMIYK